MSAATPASAKTSLGNAFLSCLPVDEFFSLDLRSLAVFRIGLGIMLVQEWLNRMVDLHAHYCDDGVVPRSIIGPQSGPISVFMLSGEGWYVGTLMGLACFFAVLMILGWRTQLVTLISWFLLIGIHGRCFAVIQGGDFVMRLLMFWAIFLPLGGCYSLDALRGPPDREWRPRVLSFGSVALIVQIASIYWFAAAWKSHDVWRKDFNAVYMSLSLEEFTSPLAHWLLNFPTLLKGLTVATMLLEIFGAAFLFMPFAQGPFRFLTVVTFCLFHTGLSVCLALGNFPWICCVGWFALLPSWFWDQLEARFHSPLRSGLTIYYDPANSWQRKLVDAARMFLLLYEAKVLPAATGEQHAGRLRDGGPWVVVDHTGKLHVQYEALVYLVQVSPLYWPLHYVLQWGPIRMLGEKLLRWAARRKPRTDEAAVDRSPYPGAQLGGLLQNTIVLFFIVYVFMFNLTSLDGSAHKTNFRRFFPGEVSALGLVLGVDQSWGLFAPFPGRENGWFLIPAELANGQIVDLNRDGAPLSVEKPELVADTYVNSRWRKLLMNLTYPQHAQLRPYYARWLYQEWNKHHGPDEQIVRLQIFFRWAQTQPDRQATPNEWHDNYLYFYGYADYPYQAIGAATGAGGGPATGQVMYYKAGLSMLPPLPGDRPQPAEGRVGPTMPDEKLPPVPDEKFRPVPDEKPKP
jgi:hypothetical protein